MCFLMLSGFLVVRLELVEIDVGMQQLILDYEIIQDCFKKSSERATELENVLTS